METFYINEEFDFEKLRRYQNKDKTFKIIINKDIDFKFKFIPLNTFEEYTIYIDGKNHTLSNINISVVNEKVGIFTRVNNLYVNNLIINNSHLYGGVLSGIICGDVEHETKLNNITLDNVVVSSEAYGGGAVGYSDKLTIEDSFIRTEVHGYDVVGGVAGMANDYTEKNSDIKSTLLAIGKAVDNSVGYSDHKSINPIERKRRPFRGFHLL